MSAEIFFSARLSIKNGQSELETMQFFYINKGKYCTTNHRQLVQKEKLCGFCGPEEGLVKGNESQY